MMKPEEIELVRKWAASGNEPRIVDKIQSVLMWPVLMWRCCAPVHIGGLRLRTRGFVRNYRLAARETASGMSAWGP
jgi:hypothetical protein